MKFENNWRNKSLEVLEKQSWGNLDEAPTHLIKRCIQLSKIPVSDFSIEDLRMLIGQQFGLHYLIPLAIEKLSKDLFAEGDLYPGDLLQSILKIDGAFWRVNQDLWLQIDELINNRKEEGSKEILYLENLYSVK